MTLFLSFPGCSHPGLVGVLPLPGVTAPVWSVASGSSELEAALPVHSVRSLRRSLALVRADDSLPLFPHLVRCTLAYGLTVSPLPHYHWSRRPWTGLCWSHLLSLSSGGSVRGYTAPVGWLRGVFPCFAYCPTYSVLKRSSFGFSASSFALSLRDGVTLLGRVCLSPRSERRLFLHLPGVWLESSRWGHPVGSGFVPDLDRNEDFLRTFPGGWCVAFAMGSPISGRVALFCALDRNEGFFHSSILSCFAMGSPCGSGVVSHTRS